ncbi:MAG: hypothetical protein QOD70_2677 [Frankiales bacterium]|nr:hypothetical protein [Frankiales bacterium]
MAYDDAPLFYIRQAVGELDQGWRDDYDNAYDALEGWFRHANPNAKALRRIVAEVDQLFAEQPDTAGRLAQFDHLVFRLETFDAFLRAIQQRAADALVGTATPMREPDA